MTSSPCARSRQTFQDVFNPFVEPPAFVWDRFARVAAWGVVGVVVSLRYFRWEPSHGAGASRRRRTRPAAPATG